MKVFVVILCAVALADAGIFTSLVREKRQLAKAKENVVADKTVDSSDGSSETSEKKIASSIRGSPFDMPQMNPMGMPTTRGMMPPPRGMMQPPRGMMPPPRGMMPPGMARPQNGPMEQGPFGQQMPNMMQRPNGFPQEMFQNGGMRQRGFPPMMSPPMGMRPSMQQSPAEEQGKQSGKEEMNRMRRPFTPHRFSQDMPPYMMQDPRAFPQRMPPMRQGMPLMQQGVSPVQQRMLLMQHRMPLGRPGMPPMQQQRMPPMQQQRMPPMRQGMPPMQQQRMPPMRPGMPQSQHGKTPESKEPDTFQKFMTFENQIESLRSNILKSFYKDLVQYKMISEIYRTKMMAKLALLNQLEARVAMPVRNGIALATTSTESLGADLNNNVPMYDKRH